MSETDRAAYFRGIRKKEKKAWKKAGKAPRKAMTDLMAKPSQSSKWDANWEDPRIFGGTGAHESYDSWKKKQDFWVQLDMPDNKPLEVTRLLLQKRGDSRVKGSKAQYFTGLSIQYRSSPNGAWTDYRAGKILPSGLTKDLSQFSTSYINLETIKASQVRIHIHGGQPTRNLRYDIEVVTDKSTPKMTKPLKSKRMGATVKASNCWDAYWCKDFSLTSKTGFHPRNGWKNSQDFYIDVKFKKPTTVRQVIWKKRGDG